VNEIKLPDTQQTSWQLAAIQLAGWTSLPVLATSILVLQNNSFLGSALTIIVGNAILWFIRLGIVSMSHDKRQSTMDLVREYFGTIGTYFIAGLSLISTFAWFLEQTTTASNALTNLVSINESPDIDRSIQVSVILGLASTLLCMEGIVLLKRLSVICFPILLIAFIVILFHVPYFTYHNSNTLSLSGLSLVLATNLGITSDIPTFFRHSKSWTHSIKALGITQIASLLLGLASLLLGTIINETFKINDSLLLENSYELLRYTLIIFIFVSAVCANVANVYSSSVGWEIVAPKALIGRQEYLMLGLGLTMLYILMTNTFSPNILLSISDDAFVNLCLVLVIAYAWRRSEMPLPGKTDRAAFFLAWGLSTLLNIVQLAFKPLQSFSPLFISTISIVVAIAFYMRFLKK
jgi:purine-cytosine permease-like protein